MSTVSTRPEATWATQRCSWRGSASTTMSHPVSRTASGRLPSPRHPASGAGTWPSLHALTGPDRPQPGPRARPAEGGRRSGCGLGARPPARPAEFAQGKKFGREGAGCPATPSLPLQRETRPRSFQTVGSRLSRRAGRLEPDNPLRL